MGCLYIGVNDVRALDWDASRVRRSFSDALRFLSERCDRVLAVTAPLDLGRPRAGAKVGELNATIEAAAAAHDALVLDLSVFGARNQVMTDHVHPTAFGQVAIAERALDVLAARQDAACASGPVALIRYETTRWQRLRGDCDLRLSPPEGQRARGRAGRVAPNTRLADPGHGLDGATLKRALTVLLVRPDSVADTRSRYLPDDTPRSFTPLPPAWS